MRESEGTLSRFEPAAVQRGMTHSLKTGLTILPFAALLSTFACGPKVNVLEETGGTAATGGAEAIATGGASVVSTAATTGGAAAIGGANTGAVSGIGGSATGGSPSTTPDACAVLTPCGGDLTGTWNVTSSCLKVDGQLDLTTLGLECTFAPVTGSLQVTGTWTANADGSFSDNTTAIGTEQIALPSSCLRISGTQTDCSGMQTVLSSSFSSIPYVCNSRGDTCSTTSIADSATIACTRAAGGGCDCSVTTSLKNIIGASPRAYCVSGDILTVAPQTLSPTTAGSIVLQKPGSPSICTALSESALDAVTTGQTCSDADVCTPGGCASMALASGSTTAAFATCRNHQAVVIKMSLLDPSATGDWAARNDGISWSECAGALAGGLSGEACTFTGKTCVRTTSDSCCIEGAECIGTTNSMLKRVRICSPNCTNLITDTSAPLVTDCTSAGSADACHKTVPCQGNFICSGMLEGQEPVIPYAETSAFAGAMWCAGGRLVGGYPYGWGL